MDNSSAIECHVLIAQLSAKRHAFRIAEKGNEHMKQTIWIVAALLVACAPKPADVAGVRVAMAGDVAGCELKGTVTGTPGVYGPLKEYGLQDARKRALELAPKLGANTVVFEPAADVPIVTEITGQAYACGSA